MTIYDPPPGRGRVPSRWPPGTARRRWRADWAAEMQHVPGLSPGEERPLRLDGMG